jgi:hypothetical protein
MNTSIPETANEATTQVTKSRGRPKLTPEQRTESLQKKKEYFQKYFKEHPDKYVKKPKDYDYTKNKGRDYEKSKIYKLVGEGTDKIYIGCSTLPLEVRLKQHLATMFLNHTMASYEAMLKLSSVWKIEPLVNCPVKSKAELEDLETIWITANAERCVNKNKKYTLDDIAHLLDGRFPESYLPPGIKNKTNKTMVV